MDKYIGKRLDGRYEIKEIIGMGGMAVVYKAYDNIEDRIVAVKILKEEFSGNEEFLRRFKNESKAVALLSHPNIVKIFDVSFGDLIQYIVMEYIDGITLKEYIEQQGSLSWKETVNFTIQILRGLQHAHDKGIVHRDVKPQNIMLLPDRTIKMADFGIARFARNEHQTMTDKAIGSVHYISPEQAKGEATDEKADIYSVGIIMYEMLTGQVPFTSKSAVSVAIMQLQNEAKKPTELNPEIPEGLEDITMHAMQKNPSDRYKTAAEMLHDLEEFKRSPGIRFEYSYFVDDSPTKFVAGAGIVTDSAQDSYELEDEEDEEESGRSPILPILAGIATTLVLALIALLIIFGPSLFGSTGDKILVPNFIGKKYSEVLMSDEYDEFNFVVKEDYSDYPADVIYGQDPGEGHSQKKGNTQITLFVSKGQLLVTVPKLNGLPASYAVTELQQKGFYNYEIIAIEDKSPNPAPIGSVVKTEPAGGSNVNLNTIIKIYQNVGTATDLITVPMLEGIGEEEAKRTIQNAGFTIGNVTYEYNTGVAQGYVVFQSLLRGEQYNRGTAIDIKVSNGLYKYTTAMTIPVNTAVLFPAGEENVTYTINVYEKDMGGAEEVKKATGTLSSGMTEYVYNVSVESSTALTTAERHVYVKLVKNGEGGAEAVYRHYTVNVVTGAITEDTSVVYPPVSVTPGTEAEGAVGA